MNENTAALARERKSGRDIPGGAAERRKMEEKEGERGEREKEREGEGIAGRLVKWGPRVSEVTFRVRFRHAKRDPVVNSSTVDHRYFLPRKYL